MDPLVHSPLSVLNHCGSLHLFTDYVQLDDALCLALTCSCLRDALWARFPPIWRPPEAPGATRMQRLAVARQPGRRVRTRPAAVVGTVSRLAWAQRTHVGRPGTWLPALGGRWGPVICAAMAEHGTLTVLQWASESGGCGWRQTRRSWTALVSPRSQVRCRLRRPSLLRVHAQKKQRSATSRSLPCRAQMCRSGRQRSPHNRRSPRQSVPT